MARSREDLLHNFSIISNGVIITMNFAKVKDGYKNSMYINRNPTANCQLMSVQYGYNFVDGLDKYQTRELLLRLRQNFDSKKILLVDVNRKYAEKFESALSPGSIISKTDYTSTNGSLMTIILIKMTSIRQFQNIPD